MNGRPSPSEAGLRMSPRAATLALGTADRGSIYRGPPVPTCGFMPLVGVYSVSEDRHRTGLHVRTLPRPARTLVHRRMSAPEVRSRGRPRQRRWLAQLPLEPERCFDRSLGRPRCAPDKSGLTPVDSRGCPDAREPHRAGGPGRVRLALSPSFADSHAVDVFGNVCRLAPRPLVTGKLARSGLSNPSSLLVWRSGSPA